MPVIPLPPSPEFTRLTLTVSCFVGGVPQVGQVVLQLTETISNGTDEFEMSTPRLTDITDGVATFADVACTDDTFTTPVGVTYQVSILVPGCLPVVNYYILPTSLAPGPVDASSLVAV